MDQIALLESAGREAVTPSRSSVKRITILNNMVTPYTNRLYNRLWQQGVPLSVVSCSALEDNRYWGDIAPAEYPRTVLRGRAFKLGPGRYAHVNSGVGAALARTRPDFLFINGFYPTMLKGAAWAILRSTPIGLITEGWRETMPNSLAHRLVRPMVLARCQAVITPGHKGRLYFHTAGIAAERVYEVPLVPAWDIPAQCPTFHERPFHLLWCAHLNNAQKNVSFFLEVVEAMQARLTDLRVRIVGGGEMEGLVIGRLEAAGVDFQHEPSLPWHKMADVYASARVLLLPSKWEPWGLVCDEAVQCGVPAIVSPHVGAADDVVVSGMNGFVLPLDVSLWADRCHALATDEPTWSEFSARARASAEKRGLERSTAKFMAMLDRL